MLQPKMNKKIRLDRGKALPITHTNTPETFERFEGVVTITDEKTGRKTIHEVSFPRSKVVG